MLAGGTRGYTRHPQLARFREHAEPLDAIGASLVGLRHEASARGYRFDATRIGRPVPPDEVAPIAVTDGQLAHKLEHVRAKALSRSPEWAPRLPDAGTVPPAHPLLRAFPGGIEAWGVLP